MEYVLETNAITKRYRGFTALLGLTMRIPKGSIYGFVGRNGAGKTTLIRVICGLQEPTDGSYALWSVKKYRCGNIALPPQDGSRGRDPGDIPRNDGAG